MAAGGRRPTVRGNSLGFAIYLTTKTRSLRPVWRLPALLVVPRRRSRTTRFIRLPQLGCTDPTSAKQLESRFANGLGYVYGGQLMVRNWQMPGNSVPTQLSREVWMWACGG